MKNFSLQIFLTLLFLSLFLFASLQCYSGVVSEVREASLRFYTISSALKGCYNFIAYEFNFLFFFMLFHGSRPARP